MESRRNSQERRYSASINASRASPRPGGFIKIRDPPPTLNLDVKSEESRTSVQEAERSPSRAQLLRNLKALYSPKSRRKLAETKEIPPCARRKASLCLSSCTSFATTDSTSKLEEEDLGGTDSSEFPVRQDADLNIIMGVVVSTVMVLADGKYSCSNDHLLWTAHFLETIKDEHGRMPPNAAGILNYIKYVRLKEEDSNKEQENSEKEPSAEKRDSITNGDKKNRRKSRDTAASSSDSLKTAVQDASVSSIRSHDSRKTQPIPEEKEEAKKESVDESKKSEEKEESKETKEKEDDKSEGSDPLSADVIFKGYPNPDPAPET